MMLKAQQRTYKLQNLVLIKTVYLLKEKRPIRYISKKEI